MIFDSEIDDFSIDDNQLSTILPIGGGEDFFDTKVDILNSA